MTDLRQRFVYLRGALGLYFLLALFSAAPAMAEDQCHYAILDTVTKTYTDDQGNVLGEDTQYFFGWWCTSSGGGYYEIPTYGGGGPIVPTQPTNPEPPTSGCTVELCQANCDIEYQATVTGEFVEHPTGGSTWYRCGPLCVDLATSDRNACYAFCVEDCN